MGNFTIVLHSEKGEIKCPICDSSHDSENCNLKKEFKKRDFNNHTYNEWKSYRYIRDALCNLVPF